MRHYENVSNNNNKTTTTVVSNGIEKKKKINKKQVGAEESFKMESSFKLNFGICHRYELESHVATYMAKLFKIQGQSCIVSRLLNREIKKISTNNKISLSHTFSASFRE